MRLPLAKIALFSLALPAAAQASTWDLDPAHSTISFTVRHAMVSNVHGAFSKASGTLEVDDKDITKSHGDITVDIKSIDTRSDKRDEHLRSPDFFDAKQFPEMTFKTIKIVKAGKQVKVHGNLSLHGVTKPLVLTGDWLAPKENKDKGGDVPSGAVKDPFGMVRTGVTLNGKLNRKDYNLHWNKALEAGGFMVGEEINLQIDAEFVRRDSAENNPEAKKAPAGSPAPKPAK